MKVYHHAVIHTLDARQPLASAIVIDRNRILAVGADDELLSSFRERGTECENLGGKTIIPGLTDAHIHLEHYAMGLQKVDCETPTYQQCLQRVADRARSVPPGEWILGHGWNHNNWIGGYGQAADLDRMAPNHPVYLTAKSLHAAWANTAAMQQAGLHDLSPDPSGGRLGRNDQGYLNGILFEEAMQLVSKAIPASSQHQIIQAIRDCQPFLWQMGLTGVHDFDGATCFAALQTLHQMGELKLRVAKSVAYENLEHAAALALRSGFGDDCLWLGPLKLFADGALGPHTAAMFQPYEDDAANRGMLFLDAEEIYEIGRTAVQSGLSLAVHAIGDRANHEVLQAYTQLRQYEKETLAAGVQPLRHRIEHVQVIHPGDVKLLSTLGIIASMQPVHAISDMLMADRFWGSRSAFAYAWRSQLNHGAPLAFGSDAPVEFPNPFWGLHAAVTRRQQDGAPGEDGWYPQQRLSVLEALQAYTTGAAYAAGKENVSGKLSPGFMADLLVLETDPFTCPPNALAGLKPQATMIAGEWVFREF